MRRDETQRLDSSLSAEREVLRDHPAHRHPDEVGALPAERIEHAECIFRVGLHRHRKAVFTLSDAAGVEERNLMASLQVVDLRSPDLTSHAEAHDEQNLRTFALDPITEPRSPAGVSRFQTRNCRRASSFSQAAASMDSAGPAG